MDAILIAYTIPLDVDTAHLVNESREWMKSKRMEEAEVQAYQQALERLTSAVEHRSGPEAESALAV